MTIMSLKTNIVISFKFQFDSLFGMLECIVKKIYKYKMFSLTYQTRPQGICPPPAPAPCVPEQKKWQTHLKNWFRCSAGRGRKSPCKNFLEMLILTQSHHKYCVFE